MSIWTVLALAVGTFAIRYAGPLLRDRVAISKRTETFLNRAATVVLVALVATSAIMVDGAWAGWALPAGVLVGGSWPGGRPRSRWSSSPPQRPRRCCGWPGSLEAHEKGPRETRGPSRYRVSGPSTGAGATSPARRGGGA
ncbi:hypothetical protein GCM10010403_46760 [Glycomyces rutgersensis]|uniref:AzlD domain-containing protein n=2 Tax=Glycomyces TaxID=58113 RepID=A0A9X3SVM6_9ACTN|nr:AzlD domain-containing protein [Glycomyces lechevalierae]MDA1386790.1 AzlD domain-containing protein [Glycomyces lechevalierae]MDR7340219.1 putative membrane protein [Glycomyces lechevalierae]